MLAEFCVVAPKNGMKAYRAWPIHALVAVEAKELGRGSRREVHEARDGQGTGVDPLGPEDRHTGLHTVGTSRHVIDGRARNLCVQWDGEVIACHRMDTPIRARAPQHLTMLLRLIGGA